MPQEAIDTIRALLVGSICPPTPIALFAQSSRSFLAILPPLWIRSASLLRLFNLAAFPPHCVSTVRIAKHPNPGSVVPSECGSETRLSSGRSALYYGCLLPKEFSRSNSTDSQPKALTMLEKTTPSALRRYQHRVFSENKTSCETQATSACLKKSYFAQRKDRSVEVVFFSASRS